MSYRGVKALLLACAGVGALLAATAGANAGGFAVREQSAFGQGSSFAGVAAGGSLSSMFWNPATMTQMPGLQSESVLSGIIPYSANTPGAGTVLGCPFYLGGTGDTGNDALVPASYYSWQVNPQLWLGLSINSPFGLSVSFPDAWAGRNYAGDTSLKTYNATPSFAYQINNMISIGAGVQIQYAKADLATGIPVDYSRYDPTRAREHRQHRRPRLGLRLHRRRHIDADADHDHRARLSFRYQPEDQGHADASAARSACLPRRIRRPAMSKPRSNCPMSSASACGNG